MNGGALDADGLGPCSAVNCTFLSNSGGAAAVMRATLTNCIIWGQAGQTTFKDIVSMSHCFIPPGENLGYADFDKNGNKSGPRASCLVNAGSLTEWGQYHRPAAKSEGVAPSGSWPHDL